MSYIAIYCIKSFRKSLCMGRGGWAGICVCVCGVGGREKNGATEYVVGANSELVEKRIQIIIIIII